MPAVISRASFSPSAPARRTRWRALAAAVVIALLAVMVPTVTASAVGDPCTTGGNPIVCENSKPGADPAEWDLSDGAGDPSIQGFATDISVDAGQRINFKIDTSATSYTIDIYRTGWYGGKGARKWASVTPDVRLPQTQPQCVSDQATELYDCGNWAVSAHWDVPSDATSGVYIAKLTRTDEGPDGGASHITFVVRDDTSHSDVVFQTSDTTWQAYNTYGGSDFYQGAANGRAYKISYNRPFLTRGAVNGRDFYFSSEYAMVRFLEQNGYDVSYLAGVDTARSGSLLRNHRTFLSVGHDEYWSGDQRANVEAARDAGVNLAFFSGNEVYWHTRWEGSIAGTPTDHRTLVSYKETWSNAKIDPSAEWTGTWRDPRFASTQNGAGRPENALSGTMYMSNFSDLPLTVTAEEGKLRMWRNAAGLSSLAAGTSQALAAHTVGYESDEDLDNGDRPAGLVRLSTTVGDVPEYLQDFGNVVKPGRTTHHITLYRAGSGALVFSAGSIQWAWGLDQTHDGDGAPADARMRQATMNLLADMAAQPVTPASGLVTSPASTDHTGPTAVITSPKPSAALANGARVTVSGTATDVGGKVAGVEVSLDGGASWHPADGRATWTYSGIQHGVGPTEIRVRATDDSANTGAVAAVGVTVACPCSVFGDTVPAVASDSDTSAVELGMRFVPQTDGVVSGVRFYKGSGNTGTHTGSLWSATGQLLAQVSFTGETATGWQTATFRTPVPVAAGQSYVVSYTAPRGGYANLDAAFASRNVDAAPLTVEGGFGKAPSGLFGSPGTFPQESYGNASYYVDPTFDTSGSAALTASGQAPAPDAASVPLSSVVSATFSTNVDPASVKVKLVDSAGGTVAGTTSYDAVSRTVTFKPSAPLAGFVQYTVTLSATTTDGRALGAGSTWTFRSVRPPSSACPCGIFDDTVLPTIPTEADTSPVTLGMRFQASAAGTVQGVRFYKSVQSTGPFTVDLWGANGAQLAHATVTKPVSSGWQETTFATPVKITAGTTYTVSYHTDSGHYSTTPNALANPLTKGLLSTPASAGIYTYGSGAPSTATSTSYLVDVAYVPDAATPTLSGRTPPDGATAVDASTSVAVTASEALASGATLTLADALGAPVQGTTRMSTDSKTVTLTPAAPLTHGARFTASFAGKTASSGFALASTWSFTVLADAGAPGDGCPCTLFGSAVPAVEADTDGAAVELGTAFTPSQDGYISGIRFYKGAGNTGTHTGSLWSATGTRLATATFTGETATGWQTVAFASPVAVTAGTTYVASYFAPNGHYAATSGFFTQPYTSGSLTAPVDAGRYLYGGGFPKFTWNSTSYSVDVLYSHAALGIESRTPAAGATDVPVAATVSATLAYAPAGPDPALTLTAGGSSIAGTSSYDSASRTVRFTPAAPLPAGATVTATVTFNGTVVGTWSFTTAAPPVTPPAGAVGLWAATDVPAVASWNDPGPIQVGTRLQVTVDGAIQGIRFYKGAGNTGTHTGYVWKPDGTQLATGTFKSETATGWQTLVFATPVTVTAGTQFVVAYYAPAGHYAATIGALANPRVNGPVQSPANGGAYAYGSTGFPGTTSQHSYAVDVLFVAKS
ncbi:DUF4082 domain-containing protein [Xylanimonas sp. McL0601]|uniref:DUF4082 domain-containing protein n=1 Tax=Xylanimonas sp. McL0601 TaxID=3414739 RepID=UPI003CEADA5F